MAWLRRKKKKGLIAWLVRWTVRVAVLSILLVALFRWVNPPTSLYLWSEKQRLGQISRVWTPLSEFSQHMPRAVVAAEDANFCTHYGFDIEAIKLAVSGGGQRGGSTLSQQVAKNVFLWQGRSWIRKGLEVWFTGWIELIWPKQRIVEVYLNIAEMDEGVFGAAAAAKWYFGATPKTVTPLQAARLAAVLPNPKKRSASRPTSSLRKRTRAIMNGAATIAQDGRDDCFTPGTS